MINTFCICQNTSSHRCKMRFTKNAAESVWQLPKSIRNNNETIPQFISNNNNIATFLYISAKGNCTRSSQAVSHPSTTRARRCLTSVIGREPVYSTWYGRCLYVFVIIMKLNHYIKHAKLAKHVFL